MVDFAQKEPTTHQEFACAAPSRTFRVTSTTPAPWAEVAPFVHSDGFGGWGRAVRGHSVWRKCGNRAPPPGVRRYLAPPAEPHRGGRRGHRRRRRRGS